ncbi:BTAD domain-containing putative transcriptional regulator [Streptomyces sp. NPDC002536]
MTALHRCDRRADALRVYQELRTILRDELGLDPLRPFSTCSGSSSPEARDRLPLPRRGSGSDQR